MHNSELMGKVITVSVAKPATSASLTKPSNILNDSRSDVLQYLFSIAVWSDESYLKQLENPEAGDKPEGEGISGPIDDEKGIETISNVGINAPNAKRMRTEEGATSAVPPGFKICKACRGWGVGLVKENGYCDHCARLQGLIR